MTRRTYENDAVRVHWNSERCIHVGTCLRASPGVFNLEASPWIDINGASADDIAATVEKCPSGALRYERLDGANDEIAETPTVIIVRPHGPLSIRGAVSVETAKGEVLADECRMTLCRCGASRNQPFCDLSHRAVGFRDNPQVISEHRADAANPSAANPPA